jgi:hypothetical protein
MRNGLRQRFTLGSDQEYSRHKHGLPCKVETEISPVRRMAAFVVIACVHFLSRS